MKKAKRSDIILQREKNTYKKRQRIKNKRIKTKSADLRRNETRQKNEKNIKR